MYDVFIKLFFFFPSLWYFPSLSWVFLSLLTPVSLSRSSDFLSFFLKNILSQKFSMVQSPIDYLIFLLPFIVFICIGSLESYCIWTYASLAKICVCTTESRIGLKSAPKGNWVGSCNSDLFPFPAAMSWIRRELMNSGRFPSAHQSSLNTYWRREMK